MHTKDWLQLALRGAIGFRKVKQLLDHYQEDQFDQLTQTQLAPFCTERQLAKLAAPCDQQLAQFECWCERTGGGFIAIDDDAFSPLLRQISHPPLGLFYRGNINLLERICIAVVGSRKASQAGRHMAANLAGELAAQQVVVVSGLAHGIDSTAHHAALLRGQTIAVVGCGLDHIYPPRNRQLFQQIIDQGSLVVSEYPLKTSPKANHFPARNRIVTGLSVGVLVVEAALKSGSLISARMALEQNREIFAVPGTPLAKSAAGCNELIKQGAKLTETVEDIFAEFQHLTYTSKKDPQLNAKKNRPSHLANRRLLDSVGYETTAISELVALTGNEVDEVVQQLMELELSGWILSVPGGYVRVRGV